MRLRNVKNADAIINASPYFVNNPTNYKGKWSLLFGNNNPIYIEIGMGKGKFIKTNAINNPNINYIGIEKYSSVMARAVQRIEETDLLNLKLICQDALNIKDIFNHEIDLIYLNFSDPWPKERHAKRRLTSDLFLELYNELFKQNIKIIMKTDNYDLYMYSKDQFLNHSFDIKISNFNIIDVPDDNVMTEYEEKFLKKGNKIYKIEAVKNDKTY